MEAALLVLNFDTVDAHSEVEVAEDVIAFLGGHDEADGLGVHLLSEPRSSDDDVASSAVTPVKKMSVLPALGPDSVSLADRVADLSADVGINEVRSEAHSIEFDDTDASGWAVSGEDVKGGKVVSEAVYSRPAGRS